MPASMTAAAPAAASPVPLIEARGVGKTYVTGSGGEVQALASIDLSVADGEFVTIVGPSGCGKSTFLRMVAGLDDIDAGRLALAGRDIAGPSRDVGVVFQSANLLPWMTVRDNVRLPLRVGGRHPGDDRRVDDLLAMTGLGDFGHRFPYELSGGMQQRAGICRALARDPRILLMDEPFGALDALTRERMNLELQKIWQANAKTIVLITHSISEAIFLGDRVVVMSARPGRVLRDIPIPIPRPRSLDTIIGHPAYAEISREIRRLLNAEGEIE